MKKNKSYELHQLIHSLSASEKKYIRWQLSKYQNEQQTKELLLFDLLNKAEEPEEEVIKKVYEQHQYKSDYLAADRNALYDEVLSGLVNLGVSYSGEIEATEGLQKAVVLFEKKLFEQALKQVLRTKKIAREYELWGLLMSLIHLEQRCQKVLGNFEAAGQAMGEDRLAFEQQQILNRFASLHYESIRLRIEYAKARSVEQIQAFETLIGKLNALEAESGDNLAFYPQFHRMETLCNYYFVKDEPENELTANSRLIEWMQAHEWYLQDQPLNYIAIQTRLLAIQRRFSPQLFWQQLSSYRQLSKQVRKQKRAIESNIFIFSHNYELDQYLVEKRWKEAFELIPAMEGGIEKYQEQIDQNWLFSAYYRFAYAAFFSGNYAQALDYILKVINDFSPSLRPDVYNIALLLQIILHYELGHYKLIASLVNSTRYHIKKGKQLHQTETLLLATLKKLGLLKKDKTGTLEVFKELKNKLVEMQSDAFEQRVFKIFNFLDWVEIKLAE